MLLGSAASANSFADSPKQPVYRLPKPSYHIWTVQDLQVLNELHNPIAVTVSGVYDNPHRYPHLSVSSLSLTLCTLMLPELFHDKHR